jgi:phosphatidylglycerophosphate synthase
MNLHRTTGRPDWADTRHRDYTYWQSLAVATRGVLTPGNVITVIGLGLVVYGLVALLSGEYWLGGGLIVMGRLLDLVDGWAADVTHTKSPLGELFDAAADKLETIAAIVVMYLADLAPWWLLSSLLLPHIVIAGISLVARMRGIELHPSRAGKVSMALLWLGLFGLVVNRIYEGSLIITGGVYGVVAATLMLTIYATFDYARQLHVK